MNELDILAREFVAALLAIQRGEKRLPGELDELGARARALVLHPLADDIIDDFAAGITRCDRCGHTSPMSMNEQTRSAIRAAISGVVEEHMSRVFSAINSVEGFNYVATMDAKG